MFFYHARIMMHFVDGFEINLPYFLLQSLKKMTFNIQRESRSIDNSLYHHELIKNLIEAHLQAKGDNWQDFLVRNHFIEAPEKQPNYRVKQSRINPNPQNVRVEEEI